MSLTICKFAQSSALRNKKIPHMMKRLLYLAMALALVACEKNPEGGSSSPKERNLTGFAQKGQFVKGSQVTAFAIGSDLVATGESFPANISDDLGAFGIAGKTAAPFFELRAEGYYFNELEGTTSSSPLYLEAFVRSDDGKANINLMTTAIRPRVKKLIKEGKTFDQAVSQAQKELLNSIGFTGSAGNFDDMDITGTTDADGMLLAFACMVQNGRSAAEVTTLIQEIASSLETSGTLSSTVQEKVKRNIEYINPFRVILCLANYYKEKNLSVSTVPAFYKYLDSKFDAPFVIVDDYIINLDPGSGTPGTKAYESPEQISTGLNVLASIDFTAEVDIPGATVKKEKILGPAYAILIEIPANENMQERVAHVTFKDASGKTLAQREFTQGGNVQYLMIQFGNSTKSDLTIEDGSEDNLIQEGAEISVNGQTYTLQAMDMFYGSVGVAVPMADQYIVCCPANTLESAGHIAKVKATLPASNNGKAVSPLYGALASYQGMSIGNPAQVIMKVPLVKFRFTVAEGFENGWSYVEFTPIAENEYLAGTASFVANEEDKYLFPDLNPDTVFESDKQRTIRINNTQTLDHYDCLTFPQTLSNGLEITVYGKNGEVLATKGITGEMSLRAGQMFSFGRIQW